MNVCEWVSEIHIPCFVHYVWSPCSLSYHTIVYLLETLIDFEYICLSFLLRKNLINIRNSRLCVCFCVCFRLRKTWHAYARAYSAAAYNVTVHVGLSYGFVVVVRVTLILTKFEWRKVKNIFSFPLFTISVPAIDLILYISGSSKHTVIENFPWDILLFASLCIQFHVFSK